MPRELEFDQWVQHVFDHPVAEPPWHFPIDQETWYGDSVMDIYGALYPRWWFWLGSDAMEIETLTMDLKKKFDVETGILRPGISLADLAEIAGKRPNSSTL